VDGITGSATGNGLFTGGGAGLLGAQALGVVAVGGFVFTLSFVIWFVLKAVIGIRVSREEEIGGLDRGEHGAEAYAGFQIID
jgi:Amt family ammonium transporter